MAYGLWLYKEVQGKDGLVRLEIKKKEYNGVSIEIDALIKDSIVLSMDGVEITDPIIGTSLTFSIADTEQIDTSLFFTPDATMYEVLLYVAGVKIWDGFLTPDSYQENIAYRDVINLTARDNLGRLNDYIFANAKGIVSISSLIPTLLQEVGVVIDYAWHTKKKSTASADISDYNSIYYAYVNTDYFVGKTYRDILEEILLSIGCQLRYTYTDSFGYHLGIYDISQLPTINSVGAIFIGKSGLKEIRPAWKEVTITQQYQLIESFYRGQFTKQMCNDNTKYSVFDPTVANPKYWRQSSDSAIMLVNPWEWTATSVSKQDLYDDYTNHIYIPVIKVDKENDIPTTQEYIAYHQIIPKAERGISIHLMINNSLRTNNGLLDFIVGSFNMKFRFNVVLKTSEKEYFLRDYWVENDPNGFLEFDLDHRKGQSNNKDQQIDININNIPEDGEIELRIYQPITISNSVVGAEGYALIKDITMCYNIEMSGQSSRVEINKKHNIKSSLDLPYGQVPILRGGYLSFANGFFASDGKALTSWKLTPDNIISYNLLELVAREHIHFNKDNYTILSGTMIGDGVSISLANNITYKGKNYAIISASHSIISGTLNVTKMQEVTSYQVAELTIIDSPLELSSGSKVGSGKNEVIQFSNDAGNAKRLYELDEATDDDREGAYVLMDKPSLPTARRVPISAIGGFFEEDDNRDIRLKDKDGQGKRNLTNIGKLEMGKLILPTEDEKPSNYALYVGGLGEGADTPSAGEGLSEVTIYLGSTPYKSDANGVIALPAYPEGGGGGGDVDLSAYLTKIEASNTYLPLSGGTIEGGANALKIKRNGPYLSCVEFSNTDGSLGSLGFVWDNNPAFFHTNGNYYPLIHSGNIGSYTAGSANLLRIADIRDTNPNPNTLADVSLSAWFSNIWNPTGVTWNSGITVRGWNTEYAVWQLASSANYGGNTQALYYRLGEGSTWYDWRRLLFNNDDNARFLNSSIVAGKYNTALTLQTNVASQPYYLCGLAFNCLGAYSWTYQNHTHAWIGLGPVVNTAAAEIYPLVFAVNGDTTTGANPTERMRIFPNGNVAIGTTADNGSRLQVDGGISVAYNNRIYTRIDSSNTWSGGIFHGTYGYEAMAFVLDNALTSFMFVQGQTKLANWTDSTYNSVTPAMQIINNCVVINKLIPYGSLPSAQFEVNGNIYASGYQLPTSAPSNPVSGGYYLYVGSLGSGAVIS